MKFCNPGKAHYAASSRRVFVLLEASYGLSRLGPSAMVLQLHVVGVVAQYLALTLGKILRRRLTHYMTDGPL